jgi:hypothetical protein
MTHPAPAGLPRIRLGDGGRQQHLEAVGPADGCRAARPTSVGMWAGGARRSRWTERRVRDLRWGTWAVWLVLEVRRIQCPRRPGTSPFWGRSADVKLQEPGGSPATSIAAIRERAIPGALGAAAG